MTGAAISSFRNVDERFVVFDCQGDTCVAILATPTVAANAATIGVLVVVGGPQYRVGSHRQFVALSRALAEAGFPTFRFDYRGMGDSDGMQRAFDAVDDDLDCAITAFQRAAGVGRVVLWGLCDGASAALMYGAHDSRLAGIVAANPWARSAAGEASTRLRHYYAQRVFSRDFWRKLLRGRMDIKRGAGELADAVRKVPTAADSKQSPAFLKRMHDGWLGFPHPILFLLSGRDLTAREFEAWVRADKWRTNLFGGACCTIRAFPESDHTSSSRSDREAMQQSTIEWLKGLAP